MKAALVRSAALLVLASTMPAGAQVEEIVVTAQKRAENLQDVPIAISALSREDIETRQVTGIGDIVAQSPGFKFGEVIGSSQVSIRGVGFSLVSGTGENSIAIHSDGVYVPRPQAVNLLYEDLGGLEVLRGPQGTLYGRNATGGVLNLISVAPPEELEAAASVGYGEFDRRRVKLSGGTGLFDQRLRVRVSGLFDDMRDDYIINDRFPGRDFGARELTSGRVSADFSATDSLEFQLRAFRAEEKLNGPHFEAYKPPPDSVLSPPGSFNADPYRTRVNDAARTASDFSLASLKVVYELSPEWSVTSLTGWQQFESVVSPGQDSDGTSNPLLTTRRDAGDRALTEELLLLFQGEQWQWVSGLYYLDEDYSSFNHTDVNVPLTLPVGIPSPLQIISDSDEPTKSYAAFTDATWRLFEALQLYGGVRYTSEDKSQLLTVKVFNEATELGLTECEDQVTKLKSKAFTGRFGAQVEWLPDLKTYAQFARGFKAGGFAIQGCNNSFLPEELGAYELGVKSTFLDGGLRLNGAAFHYDYTNLQVEEVVVPNVFVNNAQAEVNGAELEALWVPAKAWELSANVAYLDAYYTEFVNNDNAAGPLAQPEDLSGNELNRSPEWTVGGAVDYRWESERWGSLSLRVDAIYETDYFLREFNTETDKQDAHAVYNAFVNYELPSGSLALRSYVKNFTDEPVIGGFSGVLGYKVASFNPPRTWGIEIAYEFGR